MEVNRHRLWGVVILGLIALILALMFGGERVEENFDGVGMDATNDETPLDQCYVRCRHSILSFEWCAQACRCALSVDICSTGGQLVWVKGETK